jgi:hypothetical protein
MSLWDQQAFPWILIRNIRGHSDQNEVSHVQIRIERDQNGGSQNGASPRQSFIVRY